MKVIIEPYNPEWPKLFLKIREHLLHILKEVPVVSIEHVGSTSVPFLKAKPVLDIDIIIQPSHLEAGRNALTKAGYTDCGEMGVPGRFAFRQPGYGTFDSAYGVEESGELRRHTYLIIEGCTALRNHLDIRRVLRDDKTLREEYAQVKTRLAETEFATIDEYVFGKSDILCKILREAGWTEEELEPVIAANR